MWAPPLEVVFNTVMFSLFYYLAAPLHVVIVSKALQTGPPACNVGYLVEGSAVSIIMMSIAAYSK